MAACKTCEKEVCNLDFKFGNLQSNFLSVIEYTFIYTFQIHMNIGIHHAGYRLQDLVISD